MLILDSTEQVGVSNLMIVNTLPSQVSVRKMGRESTAETNSLVVDSGRWNLRVMRTYYCYWGGGSKEKVVL